MYTILNILYDHVVFIYISAENSFVKAQHFYKFYKEFFI